MFCSSFFGESSAVEFSSFKGVEKEWHSPLVSNFIDQVHFRHICCRHYMYIPVSISPVLNALYSVIVYVYVSIEYV